VKEYSNGIKREVRSNGGAKKKRRGRGKTLSEKSSPSLWPS
jgi:hypothetical protein